MFDVIRKLRRFEPIIPRSARPFVKKTAVDAAIAAASAHDALFPHSGARPLPPPRLRFRVSGAIERKSFLKIGETLADDIFRLASEFESPASPGKLLDFGCGCGRVIRHIDTHFPTSKLYGCDIDREGITWCEQNLGFGTFVVNQVDQPSDLQSNFFDLSYGISVLTHLDETAQNFCLSELNRTAKPGALVILSVIGEGIARKALSELEFSRFLEDGYYFRVTTTGRLKLDGLPDYYQSAFHTPAYIRSRWAEYFDLISYVPCGIAKYQDAVVLRKRT